MVQERAKSACDWKPQLSLGVWEVSFTNPIDSFAVRAVLARRSSLQSSDFKSLVIVQSLNFITCYELDNDVQMVARFTTH